MDPALPAVLLVIGDRFRSGIDTSGDVFRAQWLKDVSTLARLQCWFCRLPLVDLACFGRAVFLLRGSVWFVFSI